jgi:nuclear transport factor 2 (NTF2) superfamily protein
LASFTNSNAIKYFKDMEHRKINFCWKGEEDKEAIRLAFEKDWADKRKEWMKSYKVCSLQI